MTGENRDSNIGLPLEWEVELFPATCTTRTFFLNCLRFDYMVPVRLFGATVLQIQKVVAVPVLTRNKIKSIRALIKPKMSISFKQIGAEGNTSDGVLRNLRVEITHKSEEKSAIDQ